MDYTIAFGLPWLFTKGWGLLGKLGFDLSTYNHRFLEPRTWSIGINIIAETGSLIHRKKGQNDRIKLLGRCELR